MVDIGRKFVKTLHHDTYPAINPEQWAKSGDFVGRVVLITGASRGIGRSMALAFAQAGVSGLVLVARSTSALDTVEAQVLAIRAGVKVLKIPLDVSDEQAVFKAAQTVKETFGRLDVLVNNAAILEDFKLIGQSEPNTWWLTWEVNVKGTYLSTRAFLDLLLEPGSKKNTSTENGSGLEGRKIIVNLTSVGAHLTNPGGSSYPIGKLAILRFTEQLAAEYASQGLLPVSLDPGGVATDMGTSLPPEYHHLLVDTPELTADTLLWLVKDRKEWLAGRLIVVNWDVDELEAKRDEVVSGDKLKVRLVV